MQPHHGPSESGIIFLDPLIKKQDVNTRYLESYPPIWTDFKMAAVKKKDIKPIWCNISHLPPIKLTFMNRTSISKTLNFISYIDNLTSGLNIVYSRWPPLKSMIFANFRHSPEKV